jgi:sigma-E factor negative regulatory protein RseA
MHDEINQKVSQFIDDELPQHEALQLLTEIKKQPDLDARLQRYEMARAIMKNHSPNIISTDFAEKISQAVEKEVIYFLPKKTAKSAYFKSALAVAAGVAGVAVLVSNNVPKLMDIKQEPYVIAENVANQSISPVRTESVKVIYNKPTTIDPRFNSYLQAHRGNLYTIDSGPQAYAKLAGYGQ